MEEMQTMTTDNNDEIKIIVQGGEEYLITLEKKYNKLFLKLKSIKEPNKIYYNSFTIKEVNNFDIIFEAIKDILVAKNQLFNILKLKTNIRIEHQENDICIIINFIGKDISISLKKLINENDYFLSLSDKMKKIINNNEIILAIDLGTTYSCASVMLDENIIVIPNSLGLRTTPSCVYFLNHNTICVGELAKLQPTSEVESVLYGSKRLLGKNFNDKEIQEMIPKLSFSLREDNNLKQLIMSINLKNFGNNPVEFYPEQISSLILKKIVKDSEFYLSKKLKKEIKIKKAVITVPAYFNQKQREATYQAAEIAGLEVKRMINEPTAASLAYGYKTLEDTINKQILVLDFGGGTLDLTLLQLSKKKENEIYFDIKFSYGNTNFGGDDFDYIIMEKCLEKVKEKNLDIKLKNNIRLKRMCERAKIKLSTCDSTQIILEEYSPNIPIYFSLSKNDFHKYCQPLFQKFEDILKKFLIESKRSEKDISEVILIGGSNLIPKIQSIIKNIFKYSSIKIDLDPKEVVAKGAAIQAAMLSDLSPVNKMYLLDVTNLSLGINVLGNKMSKIIKKYSSSRRIF